jgi:hypothetical protein
MAQGGGDNLHAAQSAVDSRPEPVEAVNPFDHWVDVLANAVATGCLAVNAFFQACRSPTVLKTLSKYVVIAPE